MNEYEKYTNLKEDEKEMIDLIREKKMNRVNLLLEVLEKPSSYFPTDFDNA